MLSVLNPEWAPDGRPAQEAWGAAYRRYEIDRELRRSRRSARARSLLGAFGAGSRGAVAAVFAPCASSLPLSAIVGTAVATSRAIRFLRRIPPLPRRLTAAWRLMYRSDREATPVSVIRGPGGFYLLGGDADLLTLDVRRARGEPSVLVSYGRLACAETEGEEICGGETCPQTALACGSS